MLKARIAASLMFFLTWPTALQADAVAIEAAALSRFALLTNKETFGPLQWRGGLQLTSGDPRLGGYSGLALAKDCSSLTAVSDRGTWLSADLDYQNARLSGVHNAEIATVRDQNGKPLSGQSASDGEALADLGNGRMAVAFEHGGKVGIYDLGTKGFNAAYRDAAAPRAIAAGPFNGQVESLGYFAAGPQARHFMAIAETNFDAAGNTRAWIWQGKHQISLAIARLGEYKTTDLAVAANGDMFFLERNIGLANLPAMAIRYLKSGPIAEGETLHPRTIFEATVPFYAIDNMEGLALCEKNGEQRLTLISDDNFNTTLQRTLLLQFAIIR